VCAAWLRRRHGGRGTVHDGDFRRRRATLIALFFATDLYSLAWAGANDLLDANLLRWVAWLFAPMLIGIAIGRRHFLRVDEAGFRRAVLRVLAVMAGLGLLRAGWK
jgi:hypothetical protein